MSPSPSRGPPSNPLVLPRAGHALRSLIDGAAGRAAVEMDIAVQTNSMRVQKQLVRAGHGWTILPGLGIAEDAADGTLSGTAVRTRRMALDRPRDVESRADTPAVEAVARELLHQITSAVDQERWPSARLHTRAAPTGDT
ncbi:LysR substrate-binding domain-containing protein OS=Streptomyces antimycoticus OX=68175 GN=SANT12839_011380 PE=4 SV=1 [Streptomyces antimycoticus]